MGYSLTSAIRSTSKQVEQNRWSKWSAEGRFAPLLQVLHPLIGDRAGGAVEHRVHPRGSTLRIRGGNTAALRLRLGRSVARRIPRAVDKFALF